MSRISAIIKAVVERRGTGGIIAAATIAHQYNRWVDENLVRIGPECFGTSER